MKKIILSVLAIGLSVGAFAQNIKELEQEPNWYILPENSNLTIEEFISFYKESFNMSNKDSLIIEEIEEFVIDTVVNHQYYRLFHKYEEYEVENFQLLVRTNDEKVEFAFGETYFTDSTLLMGNKISETEALQIVLDSLKDFNFAWLDTLAESGHKIRMDDSSATTYPQGTIKIKKINNECKIVFEFPIIVKENDALFAIIASVEAYTGNILSMEYDHIKYCRKGEVQTLYYGYRYDLETYKNNILGPLGQNWKSKNCHGISAYLRGTLLSDSDNKWTAINERPTTTALWVTDKVWEYFLNTFGIDATSNNDFSQLDVNAGLSVNDMYYSKLYHTINIGTATNGNSYSAFDIIAHEYAHAIMQQTSRLVNYGEAGALCRYSW